MASRTSQGTGPKLSFASVAAMAPPKIQSSVGNDEKRVRPSKPISTSTKPVPTHERPSAVQLQCELQASMARLDVKGPPIIATSLEQEVSGVPRSAPKLDEEKTHLSCSSTKPASLDGKSVASGATFGMDEKESLRPDDSASVKAGEEDESYSGPASAAPSSRVGSEAGGKAFRDQFSEISERIGPNSNRGIPLNRRIIPGIAEESSQGTIAPLLATIPTPATIPRQDMLPPNGAPFVFNYQEPDEKLIEALESPKDRLFLLQLEQQVILFIRDSQEPILDLPPCNSFCRLLAHRLGDYYALTHFVDNAVSAVRLYRTPYCRLPTPLGNFSKPSASPEGPLTTQPSVKIMRRAGLGMDGFNVGSGDNTNASSMAPSKAGSEIGDDSQRGTGLVSPSDSATAKDKSAMTREEREAKYKETRDRIFKGFEDIENHEIVTGTETTNEVSRTSSTTGKKKSKKTKHNDDGFEARSQFNAYYPAVQYPGTTFDQMVNPAAFFNPYTPTLNGQQIQPGLPHPYNSSFQPAQPIHPYQIPMQHPSVTGATSPYPQNAAGQGLVPYGQHMPSQYYQPMQSNQMAVPSSAISSPALSSSTQLSRPQSQMSDQHWPLGNYPSPYQMAGNPQNSYQQQSLSQMQANIPIPTTAYQYGQLPYQPGVQSGRSQHPLPGSYNRQAFNPQTRAFVPSNGFGPQPLAYGNKPGETLSYSPRPSFQNGNVASFGQQQSLHPPMPQVPQSGQFIASFPTPSYTTRKSSNQTPRSQSPGQNTLSKWATPANLPPKPPPLEVVNSSSIANIQNMTSGQGMPTFQNGTYSKAGSGV